MYSFGLDVTQDEGVAAEWFRRAADQGHIAAQIELYRIEGNRSTQRALP